MDEDRIVTRSIEVTWGGEARSLPVLPMKPADDWRRQFVETFPDGEENDETDTAVLMAQIGGRMVDVLMAYDHSKVLGTREWIETNVTDDELAAAFLEVWRRSFRLGRLPMEMLLTQRQAPQPAR
jgi:hypothetical protein